MDNSHPIVSQQSLTELQNQPTVDINVFTSGSNQQGTSLFFSDEQLTKEADIIKHWRLLGMGSEISTQDRESILPSNPVSSATNLALEYMQKSWNSLEPSDRLKSTVGNDLQHKQVDKIIKSDRVNTDDIFNSLNDQILLPVLILESSSFRSDGNLVATNSTPITSDALLTATAKENINDLVALSVNNTYEKLAAFSKSGDFLTAITHVFGKNISSEKLLALTDLWAIGDFSTLPTIEILSASVMGEARGAFSTATNKIYLSLDYLLHQVSSPDLLVEDITSILLEEIGHFVDNQLHPNNDTAGDEGELFAATILNTPLTESEKLRISQENDHSVIFLDNQWIPIEKSSTELPSNTKTDDLQAIKTQKILQGLSSSTNIFTSLSNILSQNPLLLKKLDLLDKRIDVNTAKAFLEDTKIRIDRVIRDLNSLPNLSFKIVVDQLSDAINNIGTIKVSIGGKLITPSLIGTVNFNADSEVIFDFDFSKLFTINESLVGVKKFTVAGIATDTTITGNGNGSASLGFKFSIGIDKLGKAFVNEGGLLRSVVDLNTTLTGNTSIKGLANGEINGTGKLNLNTLLTINDGDTITNERLYFSGSNSGTFFSAKSVSFTGGINLDSATIKGSIASLPGFEIPIVSKGSLDFLTGKAELTIQQDALLDALVNATEKGIGSLAKQSNKISQFTKNIPFIGSDLSTALVSTINKELTFDAPSAGTKAYLSSHNVTIEKIITPEQFFSGNFGASDVLLLRYSRSVSDTLKLANTSANFDAGLAKFTLNGNLQATPNLVLDLRFGLDLAHGPFLLEGGSISAQLPIKGNFNGTASIGKFITGQVSVSNANFNPTAKLNFNDFDNIANEHFYLLGSNNTLSLDNILSDKKAIILTGNLALDAALTVANPAQNLNSPILKQLGSFTWNAGVQYDLVTGKASYNIKNDASINTIINLFKGKQQSIIDLFLGNLVNSNPIPKDVRTILTQKIPLLDKNLLDIIGVPKGLQVLIDPEKFHGKTIQQINDKTGQQGLDILDLSLDLIKAENVLKLLSGQDINLISLDIKQTLASVKKKIAVLPNTTIFTFYGIAGVKARVDIEAIISMLVDTTVGFDTQGFYVIESGAKAPSGRTVGNTLLSFNPTITGILTGTLDLITVLDLIDIAGRVSLKGQLGLRLDDSPLGIDSEPKVRLSGLNDTNLYPTAKIDLEFGLTSTLLPIGDLGMPLIKEGEVKKIVPLYDKSAGSLADISNDVKNFINKTKGEGGLKLFAIGLVTGSPALITAATALLGTSPQVTEAFKELATGLKENGRDMLGAAKDLTLITKKYGIELGQTAKLLYDNFSGGVAGVASALYKEITQDIADVAKGLYQGVTQDLRSIARGLYDGVTKNLDDIVKGIYKGAIQDIDKIGQAIIDEFGKGFLFSLGDFITEFLPDGTKIRNTFTNGINTFREEWLSGGQKLETTFSNGAVSLINTFANGANTFREEWISGGQKLETTFSNGAVSLINTFTNGANTFREEWISGGQKLETTFSNGAVSLINTFTNGANTFREEWISGGQKLETTFSNGTASLINTFTNGANTFREEWISGGKKLETTFSNGTASLINTFTNGANTFREEWISGGKKVETSFSNGKRYLRNTFVNGSNVLRQTWESSGNYIEDTWDSAGKYLGNNVWNSAGKFISGVGSTITGWANTVKSWF
jgi:hypothetical protein